MRDDDILRKKDTGEPGNGGQFGNSQRVDSGLTLAASSGAPDFGSMVTRDDEAKVRSEYDKLPPGRARQIAEYRHRLAHDNEHGTHYRFEVVPEVKVAVTFERWRGDDAVEVGGRTFEIGQLVAETSPEDRATAFDWENDYDTRDRYYYTAVERGLVDAHDGPFTVSAEVGIEGRPGWDVEQDDLDMLARYPHLPTPKIIPGKPVDEPLSVEDVLAEADDDGFVTATLRVSMEDLLDARTLGHEDGTGDDEHVFLAARLSPLLPHGSSYKPVGVDEDGTLRVDFTTNVRDAAAGLG